MTESYPIIAVETHSKKDCGFTVKFDRPYLITEKLPISEEAADKAIQDAYDWIPLLDSIVALNENQQVGQLVTKNGKYHKTTFNDPT
jgi:hypothetical protein